MTPAFVQLGEPVLPSKVMASTPRSPRFLVAVVSIGVLLTATLAFAVVRFHDNQASANQLIRPSGIPSQISTPLATQMQLSPIPDRPAPNFTLTDQAGRTVSLSQFKGKAVVLEFTDPHCTDVCPIVSQEIVDAARDLGSDKSNVVFLSVNVNVYHGAQTDLVSYTSEHQLNTVSTWRFVTGPAADLAKVWSAYGISVQAPSPTADVVHSDYMYFIDSHGNQRFLANPQVNHTASGTAFLPGSQVSSWGTGIALVAKDLTH